MGVTGIVNDPIQNLLANVDRIGSFLRQVVKKLWAVRSGAIRAQTMTELGFRTRADIVLHHLPVAIFIANYLAKTTNGQYTLHVFDLAQWRLLLWLRAAVRSYT